MNKDFDFSKYKKYVTPNDYEKLVKSIDVSEYLSDDLIYRMKTGNFSKKNNEKSIGIFYVDIENQKLAGMVFVYFKKEILADLMTTLEYQNHGIGTKLVLDAISMGGKYLAVNKDNKGAISIYQKCGFKKYYEENNMCYMSTSGKPHPNDKNYIK